MYIVLYIYIHTIFIQIICILLITVGCLTTFFLNENQSIWNLCLFTILQSQGLIEVNNPCVQYGSSRVLQGTHSPVEHFQKWLWMFGVFRGRSFSGFALWDETVLTLAMGLVYIYISHIYLPHRVICYVNWQVKVEYVSFFSFRKKCLRRWSVFPNSPEIPSKNSLIVHLSPGFSFSSQKMPNEKYMDDPWWRFV